MPNPLIQYLLDHPELIATTAAEYVADATAWGTYQAAREAYVAALAAGNLDAVKPARVVAL